MMKFSRTYERSILIYREEGGQGRILLRLGRTFEDGECKPDNPKTVPEEFQLLSYIVAKDPEALIDDISERFSEYLDDESDLSFRSVIFDALKLQERIAKEQTTTGGSELLRGLDLLYGKQVMEILFAATLGQDGRKTGKALKIKRRNDPEQGLPIAKIGLAGFAAIVALPLGVVAIFNPGAYEPIRRIISPQSAIIQYADKAQIPLASASAPVRPSESERVLEEARVRKQDLFLTAGFGELTPDNDYRRAIPGHAARQAAAPEGTGQDDEATADHDDPSGAEAVGAPVEHHLPGATGEVTISDTGTQSDPAVPTPSDGTPDDAGPDETAGEASAEMAADADQDRPAVETSHDMPQTIGRLDIKSFLTFDAGDPYLGIRGEGVSATYDVARAPETIFDVVRGDLLGLGSDLDKTSVVICKQIASSQDAESPLLSANIMVELGASPFVATAIDQATCDEGSYTIFPLFEVDLSVE